MSVREHLSVVAADLVSMLRTRIELFSAEVDEQKHRLFVLAAMLFAAGLFLLLAVVVGSFLVVAFFWSTEYRYWAIGLLSLAYAAIGLGLVWRVCRRVSTEATPFSATLEELHRDLVVLGSLRDSFSQGIKEPAPTTEGQADQIARGHHE